MSFLNGVPHFKKKVIVLLKRVGLFSVLQNIRYEVGFFLSDEKLKKSIERTFGIKSGYRHRTDNDFFDDTENEEGYQREVYLKALSLAKASGYKTIADVGCGSAFKLMKYFHEYQTIGFDLKPTVEVLRKRYPERDWRVSDLGSSLSEKVEIAICADVIEHVPDPDQLLSFLNKMDFEVLYISTPDRNLVYSYDQSGPPKNLAHCREWTMHELGDYLRNWFDVDEHYISNYEQATQLAICRKKRGSI